MLDFIRDNGQGGQSWDWGGEINKNPSILVGRILEIFRIDNDLFRKLVSMRINLAHDDPRAGGRKASEIPQEESSDEYYSKDDGNKNTTWKLTHPDYLNDAKQHPTDKNDFPAPID